MKKIIYLNYLLVELKFNYKITIIISIDSRKKYLKNFNIK
jgi:hypothetical protein